MKASEIRLKFLDFFRLKQHAIVDSAPVILKNDPTLMFTNAGMNQFKDIFLGNEAPLNRRVADTQKCLRVSGKHNDLEEVGVDTYHHTMFEMLGNWSFSDYYKQEAITWAWELLTEHFQIDKEKIYVTVFEGDTSDNLPFDQKAFDVWKDLIDEDRIIKANKKDNFWEMGDVGPCGPCSEIHVDMRSTEEKKHVSGKSLVNKDHPEVIEIWNLVFMELRRKADGTLEPLSGKHIDTGMGLERLSMVLQGKQSTYDTDLFSGLISKIEAETGQTYTRGTNKKDVAIRVMSDHIRAVAFTIADGALPSNTGSGYVIRRILRRAVRYAYSFLNVRTAIMYKLAEVLIGEMGGFFLELEKNKKVISQVIKEEEESFLRTLSKGIDLINTIMAETEGDVIPGEVVFELYDTFGFPADLTSLILSEHGKTYDDSAFQQALQAQKSRSRKAGVLETGDWQILDQSSMTSEFVGYDRLRSNVQLMRFREISQKGKKQYQLVFKTTPFYPEGGGQVGDTGFIEANGLRLPIENTLRENNLIVHLSSKSPEGLGQEFVAAVANEQRRQTSKNHSATHLLHYALRKVLGLHVEQKGSMVLPGHLRFDFSHYGKMTSNEIRLVEIEVNTLIRENLVLEEFRDISKSEALKMGALALFGEKYGESVRAIRFGKSMELCGGTHVDATGEIGFFKITSEGSVAAGIRRVEAITSEVAEKYVYDAVDTLHSLKTLLKDPKHPIKSLESLLEELQNLSMQLDGLKRQKANQIKQELINGAVKVSGIHFIAAKVDLDLNLIKDVAFELRAEMAPLFLVLGNADQNKATLSVALSDELVKSKGYNATTIIKILAPYIKGGGGGQPFFATAGGKHPQGVSEALSKSRELLS